MRLARLLTIMLMLSVSAFAVAAGSAKAWEKVASPQAETVETVATEDASVDVHDSYIYLTLPGRIEVKVFTILGQLVAHQQLDAGTWRIMLPARGIYILKAGSQTVRVTI